MEKFYKVTYETIKGLSTCYCRTFQDVIDIEESPEFGRIEKVETIVIWEEGHYHYGGCE